MLKAQIRIGETVGVLVIFFVLLMFGLVFYANLEKSSFKKSRNEIVNLKALQVIQTASYMPEIQCSFGGERMTNCIDILKAKYFFKLVNASDDYYGYDYYLGTSKVWVNEVYPNETMVWVFDYNLNTSKYDMISAHIPVLLYNASSQFPFSMGVLNVNYYNVRYK